MVALLYYRLLTHTHSGGFEQGRPIGTAGIANGAVTGAKIADNTIGTPNLRLSNVIVRIPAGSTTASESVDPTIAASGGAIIGYIPGYQDQRVKNIGWTPDMRISVTLAAPATANNDFRVVIIGY